MRRKHIESELERETAYSRFDDRNYEVMSGLDRTFQFHVAMGMMARTEPGIPNIHERVLRAKLLLEECMETIEKGLGIAVDMDVSNQQEEFWWRITEDKIRFREVAPYDPIETLDGLADVKVITNGTAVQFGLPLREAEYEVFCSNMTKLDENGNPVVNGCVIDGHYHEGRSYALWPDCRLLDPTKPLGKVLKPDTYVPANIVRVFVEFAGDEDEALNRAWLLGQGES